MKCLHRSLALKLKLWAFGPGWSLCSQARQVLGFQLCVGRLADLFELEALLQKFEQALNPFAFRVVDGGTTRWC